jgi:hypothetical protein
MRLQKAPWGPPRSQARCSKWAIYLRSLLDGRRVDHLFRRRADAAARFLDRQCGQRRLCDGRRADRDDLRLRRLHARTGVHLHVPLAAHPDRDARRKIADRHLQGLARRTARFGQKGRSAARFAWRLHRLQPMRAVCPTGIDIREGPQIGCITCALCIDACDKVMAQIGRRAG